MPDRMMAANICREMAARQRQVTHSSGGTCLVHDQFTVEVIGQARARYPGVKVVSHRKCPTDVTAASDFAGSTGKMMEYVRATDATYFMLLTECGLVSRVEVENPRKSSSAPAACAPA